jgi:hypothetical protein
MTEYRVRIDERASHELNVEAASEDEAVEKAYAMLTAGMSDEDKAQTDYVLEFVEFTGQNDVWEN